MKEFFKYVLATVVGLIVFGLFIAIFGIMSLVGVVASGQSTQNVSKNTVLVMNLDGTIEEQSQTDMFAAITGSGTSSTGLNEIIDAIKKAKNNDNIKGIYIEAGTPMTSYATLQEIRNALSDFKKSGKWIVAYGDSYTQGAYYVASVANKVYMNPSGMLDIHGIAAQPMYLKDLLGKVGVRYEVVKVGTFKSATEMYTETQMSEANREQTTAYVNGLWANVVKAISGSRKLTTDSINSYADKLIAFDSAENMVKYKLIDKLLYTDEVKAEVKKLLKIDEDKSINQIGISDMQYVKSEKRKGDEIAVYYAYGTIVEEPVSGLMSQEHSIVAKEVCEDLNKLADDENVKAVVLRVNSPGGSAYASEQLWRSVMKIKEKKPVVVSMGDYAASGGYYMSCAADWIVAQPTTLTGSIGIFGAFPDASELATKKLGLHFDEVKTNRNSTFGSIYARPINAEERNILQNYINEGYFLFRQRVADGRKQTTEDIEKIAQGRVWLGQDAIGIKLVDQLGGLDDAVEKAAKLAKLDEYHTADYPGSLSFVDQLMQVTGSKGNYLDDKMKLTLGELYQPFLELQTLSQQEPIQARLPFYPNIR